MIDLLVIVVYVTGCIAAGVVFSGKQTSSADYFVAEGGMKGWFNSILVGLSIAATLFSGISFLVLPSMFFAGNTVLILLLVSFPVSYIVLRYWFLPRYLAGPAGQKPYDILEQRFGPTVRTVAACIYLLFRVGWMAALIYAPTIAILGAWQLDPRWFWPLVIVIGATSTVYTVMGGIRGVIFTDALQFIVIMIGVAFVIGTIFLRLPVGLGEGLQRVVDEGHFQSFNFSPSIFAFTIWAVLIGGIVGNMGSYIGDQMSLQRYLASGDIKESGRAFMVNVVGASLVITLLAVVGIALKMWYLSVPDADLPTQSDEVFPYFIATQLPVGITGLIIAALLAATMSSMTSGINTLAAVVTLDFRTRLRPDHPMSDQQLLRFSRRVSLVVGVAATLSAGFVGALGNIFDISQTILGALNGPLFAALVLAAMRIKVAPLAVLIGALLAPAAGWTVAFTPINSLWIGPASFGVGLIVPLLLTPLLPRRMWSAAAPPPPPSTTDCHAPDIERQ